MCRSFEAGQSREEHGEAICERTEKGAAVATAEFIKEQHPDMTGFSPRNVRRMRDFWQMYSDMPELLRMIEDPAHLESVLDEKIDVWYQ